MCLFPYLIIYNCTLFVPTIEENSSWKKSINIKADKLTSAIFFYSCTVHKCQNLRIFCKFTDRFLISMHALVMPIRMIERQWQVIKQLVDMNTETLQWSLC